MIGSARLPVSGEVVDLRAPDGADDLLLLGNPADTTRLAVEFLDRVAPPASGEWRWETRYAGDIDAALLLVRSALMGDRIRADVNCPECGARFDVAFGIADYLAHHRPHAARGVREFADEPGWFEFADGGARFCLPTGADLAAVEGCERPERELAARCVRPPDAPARLVRRIERAMAALAPSLNGNLRGPCPECGASVSLQFDVVRYVLAELRQEAEQLHEDVHLIAQAYHWAEADILALPRPRRTAYADLIRRDRSAD